MARLNGALRGVRHVSDATDDRRLRVGLVTPAHSAHTLVLLLQTMCFACAVPLNPASTAAELTQEMKETDTQVPSPRPTLHAYPAGALTADVGRSPHAPSLLAAVG